MAYISVRKAHRCHSLLGWVLRPLDAWRLYDPERPKDMAPLKGLKRKYGAFI